MDFAELPPEEQDWVVAEWGVEAFGAGDPKSQFQVLVATLQKARPGFNYRTAWKVLDVWQRRVLASQAPLAPREVALAAAVVLAYVGRWSEATAILCCFVGLLRISESLKLQIEDVHFGDLHGAPVAVLCLSKTKRGIEQKVVVDCPRVTRWLQRYVTMRRRSDGPLCPSSYYHVTKCLHEVTKALGFEALALTSHSLRRGGATALLASGRELSAIMLAGRWASESSCREYLRRAEVALMRCRGKFSSNCWRRAEALAAVGDLVFDVAADSK